MLLKADLGGGLVSFALIAWMLSRLFSGKRSTGNPQTPPTAPPRPSSGQHRDRPSRASSGRAPRTIEELRAEMFKALDQRVEMSVDKVPVKQKSQRLPSPELPADAPVRLTSGLAPLDEERHWAESHQRFHQRIQTEEMRAQAESTAITSARAIRKRKRGSLQQRLIWNEILGHPVSLKPPE